MAADGTPRITWHGKDFSATTEIVKLGDVEIAVQVPDLSDPWLRTFIAAVVACERIEGANRIAPAHVLEMAACRFIQKGGTIESRHQYETELGVTKSKTRPPRSLFQPFIKWARGGRNDTDGSIGRLAAAFDAWLALGKERPDPTPRNGEPGTSQLAEWLRRTPGGYQAVAKAHNARLEYEAGLTRGTVWVTNAAGIERVYDTKAAGESQNEGPAYEEPAEWWDLNGCEPTGVGEYRRIDPDTDDETGDDPLPERIKGEVRPTFRTRPDDKNYSESKLENATAQEHHPWEYATHNRRYALGVPTASEEWYTPPQLFQAMDCTFDLDPASPGADVVHWIPARRHFTRSDNGLEQDWGDDFLWLNAPYAKENLPLWLEKFRKHANGVCRTVDRTSARWWQELCSNADLILQVNKKIQFLRPSDEPTSSSPALGHTLVAYGPRGVEALRNAARNGLGTVFKPCPIADTADAYYSESKSSNAAPVDRTTDMEAANASTEPNLAARRLEGRKLLVTTPKLHGRPTRDNAWPSLLVCENLNSAHDGLYMGDCMEVLAAEKDASVNLIVTSPPYADARKSVYGGIPPDQYVGWWLARAEQFHRVLTRTGSLIVNIKEGCKDGERMTYVLELILAMRRTDWLWVEDYIWHKRNCAPGKWPNRFRDAWEHCLHFTLDPDFAMYQDAVMVPMGDWAKSRLANLSEADTIRNHSASGSPFGRITSNWIGRDLAYPTNVLHFATECGYVGHSAAFPEELPEFFIKLFTGKNDPVCDPFMGSGTTGVVCARLNRRFIGIDILEENIRLAEKRISEARLGAAAN